MECHDAERLIDAQLDGELAADAAVELQEHLARCPDCRRTHGPLLELLRSPARVEPPDGLREAILAALDRSGDAADRRRRAWCGLAGGLAAAACLGFFLMGWVASQRWGGHGTVESPAPSSMTAGGPAVVLSPWLAGAWAQAAAMNAPTGPAPFVLLAAAAEIRLPADVEACPAIRVFQRPGPGPSEGHEPAAPLPPVPLLPPGLRPMGV